MKHIYFKSPEGKVIGKLVHEDCKLGIPKKQYDAYINNGFVPCDSKGNVAKPPAKQK